MKNEVDFEYIDFKEYLELSRNVAEYTALQADDNTYKYHRESELKHMMLELKKYEDNINLCYDIMSMKGKGLSFSHKVHHELKDYRIKKAARDTTDTISPEESCIIEEVKPLEVVIEEMKLDLPGTTHRYDVEDVVVVADNNSIEHPYTDGDRLEIISLQQTYVGQYQYKTKHIGSDKVCIVNDSDLY